MNTSFVNDLPSFDISLANVIDTYIENQNEISILTSKVTVLDSFEKPKGKFPDTYGNLVILDSKYFIDLILEMIWGSLDTLTTLATNGTVPEAI